MSVPYCLLIFLLCLVLHGCNARGLAAFVKQEKKFDMSNQSDIEKEISVAREVESSFSTFNQVVKVESIKGEISDDKAYEKLNMNGRSEKKLVKNDEKARKTSDSLDPNESIGSVSWLVPKPKGGEKHPAFTLDYSPPKTHPPRSCC